MSRMHMPVLACICHSVMPGHACDRCTEMTYTMALTFVQAAAAHEAALGGGHVTTWIAVRSHVVGQQIVATLREPVPQESCQKHSQHAETPNIQQQVHCECDDWIGVLLVLQSQRQTCGVACCYLT